MMPQPPKRALQFLRWFCRADFIEEIEGDLLELYEEAYAIAPQKAKRQFSWNVLRHFRPDYIKFFHQEIHPNLLSMLKNDLKIAGRNLKKQPFFTFLNIFGLAIGIAGSLLIALHIYDELSFNKMFADADRIYRINLDNRTQGETNYYATISGPAAKVVRQDCPQVEMVMRFRETNSKLIRKEAETENVKEEFVAGADTSFFELFGLDLIVGNPKTALKNPNTLVLTKKAALKHFPVDKALGQRLVLDNETTYIVTGVMEDLPQNSFLRNYSVFLSIEGFRDAQSPAWNTWNFPTFVKLHPKADPKDFQDFVAGIKDNYLIPWAMTFVPGLTVEKSREQERITGDFMRFSTTALTAIHLKSQNRKGEFNENSSIQNVYILGIIGCFLILLACVNFMNLSTVYSLKRAKEVGIRKTLGSHRLGLIRQFLSESFVITLLSLLVGLGIATLALPYFNELADKTLILPLGSPVFWGMVLGLTLFLGLLTGAYPAFFMSKFDPINALKKGKQKVQTNKGIRNGLVVFQFSISVFLILCTLVVFQQLQYMQGKDLGYQKDQVLVIEDVDATGSQLTSFKETVQQISQVNAASLSSFLPTPSARAGTTFFQDGKLYDPETAMIIEKWEVDHDYVSTLDLEIIAGRDFDRQYATDSSAILLNESAIQMLELTPEEAIGLRLTDDFKNENEAEMHFYTVVGVVKNFHFETLRNDIDAMSLYIGKDADRLIIKLHSGDFNATITQIEKIWGAIAQGQPFSYYFLDDSFDKTYQSEQRLSKVFAAFTLLSIFIACLGLFGLAAFNAENRVKEIGIRKVLGANIGQIIYQLSIDFLKLVGIAILIALPLGWYAMTQWLADFSFRTEINWQVFFLTTLFVIILSVFTLSYQSVKAALMNPIKSLRSE